MESVLVNGIVAIWEMTVVMVQMNSSVVSLLYYMANYSSYAVVIRSRYKQILGAVSRPSLFFNESNN